MAKIVADFYLYSFEETISSRFVVFSYKFFVGFILLRRGRRQSVLERNFKNKLPSHHLRWCTHGSTTLALPYSETGLFVGWSVSRWHRCACCYFLKTEDGGRRFESKRFSEFALGTGLSSTRD